MTQYQHRYNILMYWCIYVVCTGVCLWSGANWTIGNFQPQWERFVPVPPLQRVISSQKCISQLLACKKPKRRMLQPLVGWTGAGATWSQVFSQHHQTTLVMLLGLNSSKFLQPDHKILVLSSRFSLFFMLMSPLKNSGLKRQLWAYACTFLHVAEATWINDQSISYYSVITEQGG